MFNLDSEVFSTLIGWLEEGKAAWLCTVTSTWGSAPRDVGSLMACNAEGGQCGSLSGGCIEEDLLEKISRGEIASDKSVHMLYGESKEEAERLKLPCGGTLGVLIEPQSATEENLSWLKKILQHLEARECVVRNIDFQKNKRELIPGSHGERFIFERDENTPLNLHQILGPQFHLFLVGVSEVTRALARFALLMDYRVSVCDPRPEQIKAWNIENVELIQSMPDDAVEKHANDNRTAILALTHDPRIDDMGLLEAFNSKAFYIGAMGSMATSKKRRDRLQLLDISKADLDRLHAPIGLSIGSKTPSEIAIAILAELTQVRAKLHS
ncbi:XdhC family protein [Aurantivibrio infirmus]